MDNELQTRIENLGTYLASVPAAKGADPAFVREAAGAIVILQQLEEKGRHAFTTAREAGELAEHLERRIVVLEKGDPELCDCRFMASEAAHLAAGQHHPRCDAEKPLAVLAKLASEVHALQADANWRRAEDERRQEAMRKLCLVYGAFLAGFFFAAYGPAIVEAVRKLMREVARGR